MKHLLNRHSEPVTESSQPQNSHSTDEQHNSSNILRGLASRLHTPISPSPTATIFQRVHKPDRPPVPVRPSDVPSEDECRLLLEYGLNSPVERPSILGLQDLQDLQDLQEEASSSREVSRPRRGPAMEETFKNRLQGRVQLDIHSWATGVSETSGMPARAVRSTPSPATARVERQPKPSPVPSPSPRVGPAAPRMPRPLRRMSHLSTEPREGESKLQRPVDRPGAGSAGRTGAVGAKSIAGTTSRVAPSRSPPAQLPAARPSRLSVQSSPADKVPQQSTLRDDRRVSGRSAVPKLSLLQRPLRQRRPAPATTTARPSSSTQASPLRISAPIVSPEQEQQILRRFHRDGGSYAETMAMLGDVKAPPRPVSAQAHLSVRKCGEHLPKGTDKELVAEAKARASESRPSIQPLRLPRRSPVPPTTVKTMRTQTMSPISPIRRSLPPPRGSLPPKTPRLPEKVPAPPHVMPQQTTLRAQPRRVPKVQPVPRPAPQPAPRPEPRPEPQLVYQPIPEPKPQPEQPELKEQRSRAHLFSPQQTIPWSFLNLSPAYQAARRSLHPPPRPVRDKATAERNEVVAAAVAKAIAEAAERGEELMEWDIEAIKASKEIGQTLQWHPARPPPPKTVPKVLANRVALPSSSPPAALPVLKKLLVCNPPKSAAKLYIVDTAQPVRSDVRLVEGPRQNSGSSTYVEDGYADADEVQSQCAELVVYPDVWPESSYYFEEHHPVRDSSRYRFAPQSRYTLQHRFR